MAQMTMIQFLSVYGQKKLNANRWMEIFDIKLIDNDGWKNNQALEDPIDIEEFFTRISRSTIRASFIAKRILDFLQSAILAPRISFVELENDK